VLAIILGVGVYFGIAYGVPALQRQYVQPVQDNSLRLDDLEARHEQDIQQIANRLDTIASRLETLEAQSDINTEIFTSQQAQLDTLAEAQATQAAVLDDLIPMQTAISDNRGALDDLQSDMQAVQSENEALAQAVSENSQDIQALSDETAEQGEQLVTLKRNLQLLRTLDLLTRSRLFIEQDNYGLARATIQAARDSLSSMQSEAIVDQPEVAAQIVSYLDRALENLPDNPQGAEESLQNAWQLLLLSLPDEQTGTPTP
jgi:chromosome segregation ATPase